NFSGRMGSRNHRVFATKGVLTTMTVTNTPGPLQQSLDGVPRRRGVLTIGGLTANSDNTVPHGLGFKPRFLGFRPGSAGLWGEIQSPDSTNLYLHVGNGGATSGIVQYEE